MSWPGVITVMAEIRKGNVTKVETLIASKIDSHACDCRRPLSDLPALHCCAFVVVPAEDGLPAWLIIEATFDGRVEDFVRDLIDADIAMTFPNKPLLVELLEHCVAFPQSAQHLPILTVGYLLAHATPHNAFYFGAPGFPVARIHVEQKLRLTVRNQLTNLVQSHNPPRSSYAEVLRDMRARLRRFSFAGNEWLGLLEEKAELPWEVRYAPMTQKVFPGLTKLFLILIGLVFFCSFGLSYPEIWDAVFIVFAQGRGTAALAFFGVLWAGLRLIQFLTIREEWPSLKSAIFEIVHDIARTFNLVAAASVILAAGALASQAFVGQIAFLFAVVALAVRWLLKLPLNEVLRRAAFPAQSRARRSGLAACRDAINLARAVILVFAAISAIVAIVPEWQAGVLSALTFLATLLVFTAAGLALVTIALIAVLTLVRWLERREARKLLPASLLTTRTLDRAGIWEREEHGENRNQNHFASITWVKRGRLRLFLLRLALWFVNLSARYSNNRGTLGGIPTIISARWLLIDGGRRLLFLTNYFGPWDSYLGEFSELAARAGVNAIWSNTTVRLDDKQAKRFKTDAKSEVNWPETYFSIWGGAALEEPFKAIVRQSQIATCAWYGAYPDMSVRNIHDNALVRAVLFGDPTIADIDDAVDRI